MVPPMSIYGLFKLTSFGHMNDIVADEKKLRITRREMLRDIENLAKALLILGVNSGDVVNIANARSMYANVIIFFALNRLGAVACFHEEGLTEDALVRYLDKYDSKVLFTYWATQEQIQRLKQESTSLQHVINMHTLYGEKNFQESILEMFTANRLSVLELASWRKGRVPQNLLSSDKLALISYTSGSTSGPKDIGLTNKQIVAMAVYSKAASETKMWDKDYHRWMSYIHVDCPYGLCISILAPLCGGGEIIYTPDLERSNLNYYLRKDPDVIFAVPPLIEDMINLADETVNFSNLKLLATGGERMEPELSLEATEMLIKKGNHTAKVVNCYGTGESQGFITTGFGDVPYNPNSVGIVPAGVQVMLYDPDNPEREVGYNEPGILCAAGEHIITHYYKRPDLDATKFVERDGKRYLDTGDLAVINEEGYVDLVGRATLFLNAFGYKVYPNVVKIAMMNCSLVRNCEIVKVSDPEMRFVPYAFVVLDEGVPANDATWEEIFQKMSEPFQLGDQTITLKDYEKPRYHEFVPELPMSKAHKIDFRKLEQMAQEIIDGASEA